MESMAERRHTIYQGKGYNSQLHMWLHMCEPVGWLVVGYQKDPCFMMQFGKIFSNAVISEISKLVMIC